MNEWIESLKQISLVILGQPGTMPQLLASAVLGATAMMFVLAKAGGAIGIRNTGFVYSLIVTLVGAGVIIVVMTAMKLYLPLWDNEGMRIWILIGSGVIVSLVVVIPLICALQKAGFLEALFTWALAVAAMAIVIVVVNLVTSMVASGKSGASKGSKHRKQIESILDD